MAKTDALHILHIEDDAAHAELIRYALLHSDLDCRLTLAMSREECMQALRAGDIDVVLSDNSGYDFQGLEILRTVRDEYPGIPFLLLSGSFEGKDLQALKAEGVAECLLKSDLDNLAPAIRRATQEVARPAAGPSEQYVRGMERLVRVVQELSLARDLETVQAIVRHAARELTGADGATFVLRDGDKCYYADEEAIAPLWKGQRFPMSTCISGWTMLNREAAVIEDIYVDPRIPHDAYRPTFVKSLVMVPIRTLDPIGAIGNYWAEKYLPSDEDVKLLRALADTIAVALENVQAYAGLEQRVRHRTLELEAANRELEAFSFSVSHDLRGPLRTISGFTQMLQDDYGDRLDDNGRHFLQRVVEGTLRMSELIDALLGLARISRAALKREAVELAALAAAVVADLRKQEPERHCEVEIAATIPALGDAALLRIVLENLIGNAWKFTAKRQKPRIEIGCKTDAGQSVFYVKDNGDGFDMRNANKLFTPFQRQHRQDEFEGTGVGLATVQRIITRHGGRIRAEAVKGEGATFLFTLGDHSA